MCVVRFPNRFRGLSGRVTQPHSTSPPYGVKDRPTRGYRRLEWHECDTNRLSRPSLIASGGL